MKTIFDFSVDGKEAFKNWTQQDLKGSKIDPALMRSSKAKLPQVSELDITRHYSNLSKLNFSVDTNFYPLGSCTMKHNPRFNECFASIFQDCHPLVENKDLLEILQDCNSILQKVSGYAGFTWQPAAGAHGELTGLLIIRRYQRDLGQLQRDTILVPDSSHGTNPASAAVAGFRIDTVKTNEQGGVDLADLRQKINQRVAGLMLTNPNTLGIYDPNILEIAREVHQAGGLLYYDGANANALLGMIKPAELGFDIAHFNLHKTFSTPHGGGGPGSGPVGVSQRLLKYLPQDIISQTDPKISIGRVHSFYGNIAVVLKAYAYMKILGIDGLRQASETAVLNANYLKKKLAENYEIPFSKYCLHEFVISVANLKKEFGVRALDIAKRLMDYGIHPPTVYFPLIVKEALMIEPTETEGKQVLDNFVEVMNKIAVEIKQTPQILLDSPHRAVIKRPDETKAAKNPIITRQ